MESSEKLPGVAMSAFTLGALVGEQGSLWQAELARRPVTKEALFEVPS
jgi:hypothetical protein